MVSLVKDAKNNVHSSEDSDDHIPDNSPVLPIVQIHNLKNYLLNPLSKIITVYQLMPQVDQTPLKGEI